MGQARENAMNVVLVNPPNQSRDIAELAPLLGLLTLAQALLKIGVRQGLWI
jgi:hypothetical protein